MVDIEDSRRVTLQGFTVNGGLDGVICGNAECLLPDGKHNPVLGGAGGRSSRKRGASLFDEATSSGDNGTRGLTQMKGTVVISTTDTFEGNADSGVVANSGRICLQQFHRGE